MSLSQWQEIECIPSDAVFHSPPQYLRLRKPQSVSTAASGHRALLSERRASSCRLEARSQRPSARFQVCGTLYLASVLLPLVPGPLPLKYQLGALEALLKLDHHFFFFCLPMSRESNAEPDV